MTPLFNKWENKSPSKHLARGRSRCLTDATGVRKGLGGEPTPHYSVTGRDWKVGQKKRTTTRRSSPIVHITKEKSGRLHSPPILLLLVSLKENPAVHRRLSRGKEKKTTRRYEGGDHHLDEISLAKERGRHRTTKTSTNINKKGRSTYRPETAGGKGST